MLPHVGMLNSANSAFSNFHSTFIRAAIGLALGESWLLLVQPHKNTCVQRLPFPISVGRLSLANLQKSLRRKQGCKHGSNLDSRVYFWASLGRCLCHGIEHHGIDPNKLNSGQHDSSTKAVFICTAVKLQCCHTLVH